MMAYGRASCAVRAVSSMSPSNSSSSSNPGASDDLSVDFPAKRERKPDPMPKREAVERWPTSVSRDEVLWSARRWPDPRFARPLPALLPDAPLAASSAASFISSPALTLLGRAAPMPCFEFPRNIVFPLRMSLSIVDFLRPAVGPLPPSSSPLVGVMTLDVRLIDLTHCSRSSAVSVASIQLRELVQSSNWYISAPTTSAPLATTSVPGSERTSWTSSR
mmetsp:Transcript_14696/g.38843  ORF Transcript_14696/g.38843 Transcript_14696/m.38843 type:complete len:219 (-) Transcript_14696:393-1049(-)